MNDEIINFDALKQIIGDDKDTIKSFFDLFKEQSEIEIPELERNINENNWEKVAAIAHKLKSSYGGIGSTSAYNVLAKMEEKCKNEPDYDIIFGLFNKFLDVNGMILQKMEDFFNN